MGSMKEALVFPIDTEIKAYRRTNPCGQAAPVRVEHG
jgi:hypothetical protein